MNSAFCSTAAMFALVFLATRWPAFPEISVFVRDLETLRSRFSHSRSPSLEPTLILRVTSPPVRLDTNESARSDIVVDSSEIFATFRPRSISG